MTVSAPYRGLLGKAVWASAAAADTATPEAAGLTRAGGWPVTYEQPGTGQHPERTVFNRLLSEITSALKDVAVYGVPPWDEQVDYTPTGGVLCFVTTAGGLWRSGVASGPSSSSGPVNPDTTGQTVWARF